MATTIDPSTAGSDTQQAETVRVRVPSRFPYRTIAMGTIGSTLLMIGALGAAGVLIRDPILGHGPMSWIRYGHGRAIANGLLYIGFALIVWAWVRLGRYALARRIGSKPILAAAGCWMAPLLISPPLFTRDVFSYLGQGAQLLYGLDPYQHGPAELEVLPNVVQNVHQVWQTTPAPYGPLYLLISKGVVAVTGDNLILGVILTRVILLLGLAMTLWALPRLVRHLGGNLPITLWLAVASPMMVIHLFGGPHNDLMMIGFLTVGVVAALERKYPVAVVLITVAMLIKATAAIALPFLVWMWAKNLKGSENGVRFKNFVKAGTASVAIFAPVFVAGTWVALGSFNLGWVAGLKAPQLIANWLNPPTGVGEVFYTLVHLVVNVQSSPFVTVARFIGMGVLAVFVARQWWLARVGGTEAVLRAAISLLSVSILFPPTLPWYFTWGFVILAAFKWRQRHLAVVVAVSVFLVLVYYPTGEQALYDWWFIAGVVAVSVYAAASLLRPDPLGLVAAFKKQAAPAKAPFLTESAKTEHAE
ncbi:polyprenol phosphomannose-dependent alpha 1,6 mannosyltransferase MptB [Amycolatopsis sp. CA-230715]|uniref:polyprenol phosphomannose-dependent alpha 1,6 mannosyltransferase MptB n=1 Tax=Amycolatopsis sp. CA-230715 TaxID=2745196 RepID=UPI001C02313C|nr:polyprenol phosphomannose-dependent alpha 1,6 mannosyltransferase MptB [Amycolatopsis sp. CA-230715]QWF85018.1 Alpha-(1->6)-mannopyranosyltransferase A [Amycolatopsis sp. CA-230715]